MMLSHPHRCLWSCIRLAGFICVTLALLSTAWIENGRSDVPPMLQFDDPELFDPCPPGPFSLHAKVEEAVEGGPVIVSLQLHYKGQKPLKVLSTTKSTKYSCIRVLAKDANPFVGVNAPIIWREGPPLDLGLDGPVNCLWGHDDINPGDCFSTTVYVQHYYTRIPAGRAILTFTWDIVPLDLSSLGFRPTTSLTVDVAPATVANLNRFGVRIKAELSKPLLGDADHQRLANCLFGSRHKELVPIAQDIIAAGHPQADLVDQLKKYIHSCADDATTPRPTER